MIWADSKMVGGVSELTLLTPITPGPIPGEIRTYEQRLRTELQSVQQRVNQRIPTVVGIIPTIHFARWLILRPEQYLQHLQQSEATLNGADGSDPEAKPHFRSWLLFCSAFDGDLRAYLRDFSVFVGSDVDRIWGNCEGYPVGGARDFEHYWNYAKRYQIPTDVFYNAYPGLSVPRIHELHVFRTRFDEFVARTRKPNGQTIEDVAALFDEFLKENCSYAQDFPSAGGIFPDAYVGGGGQK